MVFKFVLWWVTENSTRYLKLLGLITGTTTIAGMGDSEEALMRSGTGTQANFITSISFTELHDVYRDPHRTSLELQSKDPPTGDQAVNPPTGQGQQCQRERPCRSSMGKMVSY